MEPLLVRAALEGLDGAGATAVGGLIRADRDGLMARFVLLEHVGTEESERMSTTKKAGKKANGGRASGARRPRAKPESDPAVSYDEFKDFEGQKYTGMKVGRSHKWYYDQGEWKETKITPDLWQISYAVNKRRAGRAPEGSGVPVGTEYHWYVLAHQNVRKLNANDYTTSLFGLKFKIAHKRADNEKWSATEKTQRKRMIAFLEDVIVDLKRQESESAPASDVPGTEEPKREPKRKRAKKAAQPPPRPSVPPSLKRPTRRRRESRTT
jgi:hypothetical protein